MGALAFKNPLAVVRKPFSQKLISYAEDSRGKTVICDEVLGAALGFADPVAAIESLYDWYQEELIPHSLYGEVDPPHPSGRTWSRAFDLYGAMFICRMAHTPNAAEVFASLKGKELQEDMALFDAGAVASTTPSHALH